MTESVTQSGVDQAEGLRSIFGAESSCVVCLASALDVDTTIHLGHGTAHALKNEGYKTLLLDEFGLSERRTMAGFLYPTRYDLAQALSNGVNLLKVIRGIDDHFWYATAAKIRALHARRQIKLPTLDERLLQAGLSIDYILVPTTDPNATILSFYGRQIKRFVVSSPDHESLSRALAMVREMCVFQTDESYPVLIIGGASEEEGQAAFQKLAEASQTVLHQALHFAGWIRAFMSSRIVIDPEDNEISVPVAGPVSEFILPVEFFKTISAKITA